MGVGGGEHDVLVAPLPEQDVLGARIAEGVVAVAHAREYHRFVVPVLRVEPVGGHLVERHTLDGAGSVEGAVVSGPSVARVPIDESRRRGDYEDERRQMNERDANHLGACHGDLRSESHVDTSLFTST